MRYQTWTDPGGDSLGNLWVRLWQVLPRRALLSASVLGAGPLWTLRAAVAQEGLLAAAVGGLYQLVGWRIWETEWKWYPPYVFLATKKGTRSTPPRECVGCWIIPDLFHFWGSMKYLILGGRDWSEPNDTAALSRPWTTGSAVPRQGVRWAESLKWNGGKKSWGPQPRTLVIFSNRYYKTICIIGGGMWWIILTHNGPRPS